MTEPEVPLVELSDALDEIYRLRRALAYEAGVIEAHLALATFPKSRRTIACDQIHRMEAAARGQTEDAYSHIRDQSLRRAMETADASQTLTRSQFRAATERASQ